MEKQAYDELTAAAVKIKRVRDAREIGDLERSIVIDVYATLRTVLAMYADPEDRVELPDKRKFSMTDLNPFKGD